MWVKRRLTFAGLTLGFTALVLFAFSGPAAAETCVNGKLESTATVSPAGPHSPNDLVTYTVTHAWAGPGDLRIIRAFWHDHSTLTFEPAGPPPQSGCTLSPINEKQWDCDLIVPAGQTVTWSVPARITPNSPFESVTRFANQIDFSQEGWISCSAVNVSDLLPPAPAVPMLDFRIGSSAAGLATLIFIGFWLHRRRSIA